MNELLGLVLLVVQAVIDIFLVIVLWRLIVLLPPLTTLVLSAQELLDAKEVSHLSTEQRLLQIEDLLRINRITQEEHDAKRREILNDL